MRTSKGTHYYRHLPCLVRFQRKLDGLLVTNIVWEKVEALLCSTRRFMCIYYNKKVMQKTENDSVLILLSKKGSCR